MAYLDYHLKELVETAPAFNTSARIPVVVSPKAGSEMTVEHELRSISGIIHVDHEGDFHVDLSLDELRRVSGSPGVDHVRMQRLHRAM